MKYLWTIVSLIMTNIMAQPVGEKFYFIEQRDSIYYLLSDHGLYKFYSSEVSGEFFLTDFVKGDFPPASIMLNDGHLFISYNDTVLSYSNKNAYDLTYEETFVPGYPIYSFHGFGPYFFIRTGNVYNIYNVENGNIRLVEESLFTHPNQQLVFFTYPYVVSGGTIYRYVEGFDLYPVISVGTGNVNVDLTGNTIISYYFYYTGIYPNITYHSTLHKYYITQPSFAYSVYDGWGMNITQLHQIYGMGKLYARKNLYYMTWVKVITTYNSHLAYLPAASDKVMITDDHIFLLQGDTVKYSKWNNGSVFFPLTWTNLTHTPEVENKPDSYNLLQNYPNPFNPTTTISYSIKDYSNVNIKIFDILGNEIETLVDEEKPAGTYEITWNAANLPSGVYFYRLQAGDIVSIKKMILLQ